jgi:alginate O-acetyltransferase complex protein AlgI
MYFNSVTYLIFLPIVFIAYWMLAKKHSYQNVIILISSYVFYGWWDYRFLGLLFFSTFLDFFTGLKIHNAERYRKTWLLISVVINLGFLAFFKYYNFFIDSFAQLIAQSGIEINTWSLNIILPVGISFYTFHGLSYVFDIYYKRTSPTSNFIEYSVFVSFFPLLVAGPIERATHLLPQVQRVRTFDFHKAVDGLRQILWGLFKKVVIADSCATFVNMIFSNSDQYTGGVLVLGAVLFAFQIYGDFSGYSDIALGTARLFGFDLLKNFAFPYFSRDIAEFWRRWHISLSSWFRDYLYFPLGGSRAGVRKAVRNTFIIFLVSGFWHGANWTFLFWGGLHALYFIPLLLLNKNRAHIETVAQGRVWPSFTECVQMIFTFTLVSFAWIFFRAENLSHAFQYISSMTIGLFSTDGYKALLYFITTELGFVIPVLLVVFMGIEWLGREHPYALSVYGKAWPKVIRWGMYYTIIALIFLFAGKEQQFIYFQF